MCRVNSHKTDERQGTNTASNYVVDKTLHEVKYKLRASTGGERTHNNAEK
jgi:hypothetical protein